MKRLDDLNDSRYHWRVYRPDLDVPMTVIICYCPNCQQQRALHAQCIARNGKPDRLGDRPDNRPPTRVVSLGRGLRRRRAHRGKA